MRRVIWFTVGAGVGVFVVLKARDYARKITPQAVQQRVSERGQGLLASVAQFTDTVSRAMAERETELRDTLGLTDDDPGRHAAAPVAEPGRATRR